MEVDILFVLISVYKCINFKSSVGPGASRILLTHNIYLLLFMNIYVPVIDGPILILKDFLVEPQTFRSLSGFL